MIPWMESSFLTWHECSKKEGLKRSSQDDISSIQWGWEKPSIDLKVFFSAHTKAVTQPQITKKFAAFCYDFPKKTGSSRQWCPAVCAWFHALKMPTWLRNFSCVSIQLGDRWMIFDYFPYIFMNRAIHSAHFGGVETPRFTSKIHHPERPEPWLWPNPVTPDSTKRAYRLWTPTCLQGADLGTSGTA